MNKFKLFCYFSVVQLPVKFHEPEDKIIADSSGETLIFLDGGANIVYKMNCNHTDCVWDEKPQKLKLQRLWPTIMLIPESVAKCD